MPKPGGDRRGADDVEWDFSFVGPREEGGPSRDPDPPADAGHVDWDFSFVDGDGRAGSRRREAGPVADDEVDWDFSFVGDPTDSPRTNDALVGGATQPDWDFSFVDGVADEQVPHAAAVDTDAVEVVVAEMEPPVVEVPGPSVQDDREHVRAPDASAGEPPDELVRPARIDHLEAPVGDPTEELESYMTDTTPVRGRSRDEPVKVLTICTHNRTRSVMMMALLQAGFDRTVGEGRVMVRSLGFGPEGEEAIPDAVEEMEDRGLDVSRHRSLQVTTARVRPADLILTAERDHVAKVAEASPDAFRRTFTLPELCLLMAHDPVPGSRTLREWLHSMSSARTPATYLAEDVPEIDDPTGSPRRQFALATATIESMCDTVVDLLEVSVGRPGWRERT